jgi:hypothetical protein
MKTEELIDRNDGGAARLASQIVQVAKANFVEKDVAGAVDIAITRFTKQLRELASKELKHQNIKKIK